MMNVQSIILLGVLLAVAAVVAWRYAKRRKKCGGCGCCDCSMCELKK